jgi:hypothetical protein
LIVINLIVVTKFGSRNLLDSFVVLREELRFILVVHHDGRLVNLWNWTRLRAGVLRDVDVVLARVEARDDQAWDQQACVNPLS